MDKKTVVHEKGTDKKVTELENIWRRSYTKGVPRNINYEEITMSEVLKRNAEKYPHAISLQFVDTKIQFAKFNDHVNKIANALIDMGVAKGDRVAVLLPNIPQVAIAVYAVWRTGGIAVMNNPLYTDKELEHQLNDSGAILLIALDLLVPRMLKLKGLTGIKKIVVTHIRDYLTFPKKQLFPFVARDKHKKIPKSGDVVEWTGLLREYPALTPKIRVELSDVAALQYTGGTTGVSKGVVLTHSNFSKNCQQGLAWLSGLKLRQSVVLGSLPIFHAFGLFALNMSVRGGWSMVLLPRPTADAIMEAIAKQKVNIFPGVPTMFIEILNHPSLSKYDFSSLNICISGAAPCPVDVLRRFKQVTGATIIEGYGISEASPAVAINPLNSVNKPSTIGLPLPDTIVKIMDLNAPEIEMPIGEAGELLVKGPQVSDGGYYNMEEETGKTFRDGWLLTGDVAKLDEDGYITIVERVKDMIISSGYNVYPRDIEEVLFSHPLIAEACAKGVSHPKRGEVIKAFVVLKRGADLSEAELDTYCREHLAAYKVPSSYQFMESFPKSAVGKVLKKNM